MTNPIRRLRALASRYEVETSDVRAEQIVARVLARADHRAMGRLRAFGARLEAGTRAAIAERIAVRAVAAGSQRSTGYVLRRIGAVAAAAVTLSVGAVGVGAIANQASPGDLLYGVDRAYETAGHVLGSKAPHTEERLAEALVLIDKGRSADAVALVDEAVRDYSVQNGLTELEQTYADARSTSVAVTSTTAPGIAAPAPPTTVVAAPQQADPVKALRLAVEMLLRNVQAAGTEPAVVVAAVTDSALQAAAAASAVVEQEPVLAAGETTTSTAPGTSSTSTSTTGANTITLPVATPTTLAGDTTTTSEATTTLTMPDETTTTLPGDTTTTTAPDETSTTTTTAPDGTSTTTTTAPDDGSGGIILPPQP